MNRKQANIFYFLILFVVVLFFLINKYDKPLPTEKYRVGYVTSIVPAQWKHYPRSKAYIEILNGPAIIKSISLNSNLRIGQKITFRIYESKITKRTNYIIQSYQTDLPET